MGSHDRWVRAVTKTKENPSSRPLVRTSSQQLLKDLREGHDLSRWEPELCIQMLRLPSVHIYTAIGKLLERASKEWLLEFLERDGLGVLLESLNRLGDRRVHSVADTLTQIQCMTCLRAVMNFRPGLHYIVEHHEYTRQLARILSSSNPTVKLQVYELLCAVSLVSVRGHDLALDALQHFKVCHGLRYRFEIVLSELKTAESDVFRSTLLAFVNCLVLGCEDLHQRDRIRNEFLGLGLGGILSELRNSEHELIQIQVEVFDNNLHRDQTELEKDPTNLSPSQLFDIISTKVADSPQALYFHSMLLNLSQLDTSQSSTDRIWETLEDISAEGCSTPKNSGVRRMRNFATIKTVRNETTQTPNRSWPRGRLLRPASAEAAIQVDIASDLCQNRCVKSGSTTSPIQNPPILHTVTPLSQIDVTVQPPSPSLQNSETNSKPLPLSVSETLSSTIPQSSTTQSAEISQLPPSTATLSSEEQVPSPPSPPPLPVTSFDMSPTPTTPPPPPLSTPPTATVSSGPLPPPMPMPMTSFVPPPPPLPISNSGPPPPPLPIMLSYSFPPPSSSTYAGLPPPPPPPPPPPMSLSGPPPPPPPPPPPMSLSGPPPPPPPPPPMSLSGHPPPPPPPPPMSLAGPPPPPPPPPPMSLSGPPPPPPPPMSLSGPPPPPPPMSYSGPPQPPPISLSYPSQSINYMTMPNMRSSLPCDLTDSGVWSPDNKFNTWHGPRRKMKTINWTKIPKTVIGNSVWTGVEILPKLERLDIQQLEELFCQKTGNNNKRPMSAPVRQPIVIELNLLDSKRSLAVNICLKQIKGGGPIIVKAVENAASKELGAEKLRALQRLLPEKHELELLSSQANEVQRFGAAEKFYYELSKIPGYTLRMEAMLQKEDFPIRLEELRPQLNGLVNMCNQLVTNSSLREFLALVLQIGNCLNAGSYAGNAAGFKLNTLPKLLDTRANKPRMTFLHFVVQIALSNNKDALAFTKELSNINNICRISVEGLEEEIRQVASDITTLDTLLNEDKNGIRSHFEEFMEQALKEVEELKQGVHDVKDAAARLACHFCEDPTKFQPEECFKLFSDFFRRVDDAQKENEQRQKQEQRAAQRTVRSAKLGGKKPTLKPENSEVCLVDRLMQEIRSGTFKLRRSEG